MKPEAKEYLDRAREDLDDARKIMAAVPWPRSRHARPIMLRIMPPKPLSSNIPARSHSGVRSEFSRLLKDTPNIEKELLKFIGQAYKYKEVTDYGVGQGVVVSHEEAIEAINDATRFIELVSGLLRISEG